MLRFLLDENIHHKLIPFLIGLDHDAKLSPKGLVNGDVLALALLESRVLVTHDADFAEKIPPPKHSGIILVKIFPRYFDQLTKAFAELLREKNSAEAFVNKLIILSEKTFDELPFRSEDIKS